MTKVRNAVPSLALMIFSVGCGADPDANVSTQTLALSVAAPVMADFADCAETIGLTSAPTSKVRSRVPQRFALANDGGSSSPLLVRTAHCDELRLGGDAAGAVTIVQIGALVVSPDGSGDVNSYLFWYDTDNTRLAAALRTVGLPVESRTVLTFREFPGHHAGTRVRIRVDSPNGPELSIVGLGAGPFDLLQPFDVNWWFDGQKAVLMHTHFPTVLVEQATLDMMTPRAGALGRLIGGESTSFPIRHEFNRIAEAQMQVTTSR